MREEPATTLSEVSDAWLVGRARELNAAGQHGEPASQRTTVREADSLLMEAQRRGEPRIVAQLLRHCASMRLACAELADEADPLLEELLHHTKRHGLEVLQADAHALRGKRALLIGSEDSALTEVAQGLAMLDDELAPDRALGRRSWERLLATSLIDLGLVLTQLGVYEMADEVMARAHQRIRESGGPHEIAVHLINRCRMQLAWGLRLERVGLAEDAANQFSTAAAIAVAVEAPWRESLFPRVSNRSATEQMPVLGAAHALDAPGSEHIPRLEQLRHVDRSMHPREQILIAIALSRCLVRADHRDEATRVLSETLNNLAQDTSEQTLRISLAREFANLAEPQGRPRDSLRTYALELEKELWAMRETRVSTLATRLENSRLNHKHDAITRQAHEDPLTGLSNRRALDGRLETLLHSAGDQPLAVALVDLDGFKGVNDRCSHAEGDDVLRTVARTLRDTLRTDDFLARYGGDEFVVLLPGAGLDSAEAALTRAVSAVDALPGELSRGVTLSIGVVALRRQESAAQALARADAAMYQAKRNGGNRVSALSGVADTEEHHPTEIDQAVWIPPDARW
ncbi:sensor domain-containing diguanylate cyclase [Saccharopolyspora griseoalba]|uniref:Diguanylate cyclase domain-containing protein n=1 Tax=Saccharopolyspora griseoalba TaxID=1431848 RepID=A0ABW2LKJ8_9PSEU